MSYIRISIMKPLSRKELEVQKLNLELVTHYRQQPGCVSSRFIEAHDGSGEMGRLSEWESEHAADAAATNDHSMFLRSRVQLAVRKGHLDRSFKTD
ncbi:MAG: antibiotic biosynthesis monooxygenase [Chloroflexota bacterium]